MAFGELSENICTCIEAQGGESISGWRTLWKKMLCIWGIWHFVNSPRDSEIINREYFCLLCLAFLSMLGSTSLVTLQFIFIFILPSSSSSLSLSCHPLVIPPWPLYLGLKGQLDARAWAAISTFYCGFSSNWILHYFPTVRVSVCHRRDISHFSHI